MKIEMGESLGYSYLRHVKNCWLVQTNWKASEHWDKFLSADELETVFREMRQTFDLGGSVFKGTRDHGQFLRQAEIDVMGVDQDGSVHAIDVAFHEAGLNYGGGVGNRVLKKLLRTVLVLTAYLSPEVQRHIYFVSPKVHRAAQEPLEDIFSRLRDEYPDIGWHLLTNEAFAVEMLAPTLVKGESVADTAELFLRAHKLLELRNPGKQVGYESKGDPRISFQVAPPTSDLEEGAGSVSNNRPTRVEHKGLVEQCRLTLQSSGFDVNHLSGDGKADLLVNSGDSSKPKRVRVVSRVEIRSRLFGEGLNMCFSLSGKWYLLPHDRLVEIAGIATPWLDSKSWKVDGWYSSNSPSRHMMGYLEEYAV